MLPGMSKAKVVKMEKHSRIRSYLFWFDLIISQNDKIYRSLSNIVNNVRRKRIENATQKGVTDRKMRGERCFQYLFKGSNVKHF